MINIRVTDELATYMSTKKLRLDEVFVVVCFSLDKLDLLRTALGSKSQDQLAAYFQAFERKMLLKKVTPELVDFEWDNYEVTEASKKIFEECSIYLMDGEFVPVVEDVQPGCKDEDTSQLFERFVESFLELWPEGVRNRSGDYLRSNKRDIFKKMLSFMKKYPYDGETILAATKRYLKQQAANDQYAYANAAHYFISKGDISKLATECEAYMSKGARDNEDTSWTQTLM